VLRGKVRALLAVGILGVTGSLATPARSDAPKTASAQVIAPKVSEALAALVDWVKGRGGSWSAQIVNADTGVVWAEAGAQTPLNPASNMKVLTAAVALKQLGPEFCFSTGLYGRVEQGRVGSLVLRGHGDPSLQTADLWQLARTLPELGVTRVGEILVDQSRFDAQFVPPAFEQQPNEWANFRAPVSAVAIDGNSVTLNVLPTSAGQPARAWFEPPGIVTVDGAVETLRAGSGEAIRLELEPRGEQLFGHIGGHAAEGLPRLRFERRVDDPRRAAGLVLRELLLAEHIAVEGAVGLGGEAVQQRIAFHQSAPLAQLVHQLGKHSDNFYAEMLFKVLGAEAGSVPARSQDGARVVKEWLRARGALSPDTRIENGSGLFDANRVSAATLVSVLKLVRQDPGLYPEFLAQLSIGGVDGTLHSRFRALKDSRSIRAKTGTLSGASALSGYVLSPGGAAPIAFSFLINGIEGHVGEARQHVDRVVEAIAAARARATETPSGSLSAN
jgi:serine-type D-Ala-D-Ala carboxypeptidase/endopeptidase (penicillin-binding protein 4)